VRAPPFPFAVLAACALSAAACACGKSAPPRAEHRPDCAVFEAMRRGEHVTPSTTDPAVFWSDVEACYAPPGASVCERAWTMLLAVPSMANPTPAELERQRREYLDACATLPGDVQLCLSAYGMRHEAECGPKHARERLDDAMGARR
jgi:hypothetical protein